jgi:hypothetical protein
MLPNLNIGTSVVSGKMVLPNILLAEPKTLVATFWGVVQLRLIVLTIFMSLYCLPTFDEPVSRNFSETLASVRKVWDFQH